MTVTDIAPRDESRPRPTVQQQDAHAVASTVKWFTDRGLYADATALAHLRDAAVGRVVFHMSHHEPTPERWRRCAEMLALSVENQLRATPGGRLFLANRSNRIPRTWWEATS